jgi:hypothetical protein
MGQTKLENKNIFRHIKECRLGPTMDRYVRLLTAYLLKSCNQVPLSFQKILQLLRLILFERRYLLALLRDDPSTLIKSQLQKQFSLT